MFGFQGGELPDTVARKKGYQAGSPEAVGLSDPLRSFDDQE